MVPVSDFNMTRRLSAVQENGAGTKIKDKKNPQNEAK